MQVKTLSEAASFDSVWIHLLSTSLSACNDEMVKSCVGYRDANIFCRFEFGFIDVESGYIF